MKKFIYYLKQVRRELMVLLILSIVSFFVIELGINSENEIFKGSGKIGQFFSRLSIAYISAFIFYFLVIHKKSIDDRDNVNEFVGLKVSNIITSAHLFVQPMLEKTDKKARFEDLSMRELSALLRSTVRTATDAPYIVDGENASWMQWWEYLKESTEKSFDEIFLRYPHLDSELIKILTRMRNGLFFEQWQLLYYIDADSTFEMYDSQLKMYFNHLESLQDYSDKYLKGKMSRTSEFMGYKSDQFG